MRRLLLTLRYDGTRYCGWQVQPNGATVQQTLQDALQALTGTRPNVTGCSRTDAGVHADMFCCTVESKSVIPTEKFPAALNAHLPFDIAVYACQEVPTSFHPRYDAVGKRYVYRVWNAPERNPFLLNTTTHIRHRLDAEALHRQAQDYVGTFDYSAFCAAGSTVQDRVRTVREFTVTRQGDVVTFAVEANGFLYNMVRIMVGTLLDIASGRLAEGCIPEILASGDRNRAGVTAPAEGLCLQTVFYKDIDPSGGEPIGTK